MAGRWRQTRARIERLEDEEGQGLVEYGLILAFIALACVAALSALGGTIAASSAWTIP